MRKPDKLKIINMYPKNSSGYKKKDEVLTAAMRSIKSKSTENYFIALTMMGDGWEYRTNRIMDKTGLTESQVSNAKKDCIGLGLITIDDIESTLTINYERLSPHFLKQTDIKRKRTHDKHNNHLEYKESLEDEDFPECLHFRY